ncbi:GGDEF domain-containing protein [Gammaproteobacteria bacterium]|nr:GGDEF domain-containing protein [Gammaproteobacteria bacterium]
MLEIVLGKNLTSFRNKVLGLTLLAVLGSQVATVIAVLVASSEDANTRAYEQMDSGIELFRNIIDTRAKVLDQSVRPLASDTDFKRAIAASDVERISEELTVRIDWVDADLALLLALDGTVVAATDTAPEDYPSLISLTQKSRAPITINNSTYEMVTVPVEAPGVLAWISIGFIVDDLLAQELSSVTGLELTFLTGLDAGRISFLGSSLPRADRDLILNATLQVASGYDLYKAIEPLKSRYISNREYFFPEGDEIFVVLQKPLVEAMAGYDSLKGTIYNAAATSLLCALLLAYLLSRSITSPVRKLLIAARRIGAGNYAQKLNIDSNDELGELANAFESMRKGISEREQRIYYQAQFDELTDLPNRLQGVELLRKKLSHVSPESGSLCVLVMHLQRFREIQSSLGHEIGDEVLRQTALRLKSTLNENDILARLEGDQFLIIIPDADVEAGKQLAKKLADILDAGLSVHSVNVSLDACIGICVAPEHGRQPDDLLRRAAVAKNDAQNSQRRIRVYQNGREARHVRQLAILGDLRRSTRENELKLYLQPKITLDNTQVCGAEALLRWDHPELGRIPPDEFIPLAESAGSISMITRWVIDRTVNHCSILREQGINLPIAVNLSGRDLMNNKLTGYIRETLEKYGMPATCLILEITEEAVVQDMDQAIEILNELRAMGCCTSMDDFGTGYSSLAHLQKLPVDELKIDRAFVTSLPDDPQNTAIVRSIIELAHNLNLEVVAEGVETTAALRWLREEGCERAQGYYLSRPMEAEHFASWLNNWERLANEEEGQDPTDSLILRPRLIT